MRARTIRARLLRGAAAWIVSFTVLDTILYYVLVLFGRGGNINQATPVALLPSVVVGLAAAVYTMQTPD